MFFGIHVLRSCVKKGAGDWLDTTQNGKGSRNYSLELLVTFFKRIVPTLSLGAALILSACSVLPSAGPSATSVTEQAGPPAAPNYELVDISPAVLEVLNRSGPPSLQARFGDYRPPVEPRIGVGDHVSVAIYEASSGGLFSSAAVSDTSTLGASGSRGTTLPDQVVGRDGAIKVPYAGRVDVAGSTVRAAEKKIEQALAGKAVQPQVIVNVTQSASDTVTVTGEVANGARVPLNVNGDRIMDVIALAGGIRAPVNETYVELSRGRTTVRVPLTRVASDPREDIYVRPNDVLTLVRDPQTFIAYGATGQNAEIHFDADGITLAQALAKAGGLMDMRSDPSGVFIFRYEPASVARELDPNSPLPEHGRLVPVAYRLNLRDVKNLFLAQRFRIKNRDLVYVSDAPIMDVRKAFSVFESLMQPAATGASLCLAARC